jgi:hypothetical protein
MSCNLFIQGLIYGQLETYPYTNVTWYCHLSAPGMYNNNFLSSPDVITSWPDWTTISTGQVNEIRDVSGWINT